GITSSNGSKLVTLGSISHQPLLVFYRSATPVRLLSEFKGKRLAVGQVGSGTRSLDLTLLQLNGILPEKDGTTLLDLEAGEAAKALLEGRADAVFLMGDSASPQVMRQLLRAQDVQLMDFVQADAYSRKITYLNKLDIPEGGIDLGSNIPPHTVRLIGPN